MGENINDLIKAIARKIMGDHMEPPQDEIVPNMRQAKHLEEAKEELTNLLSLLSSWYEVDLIYTHLENTVKCLKEITGEITTEDVLDKVFSNFCIGK